MVFFTTLLYIMIYHISRSHGLGDMVTVRSNGAQYISCTHINHCIGLNFTYIIVAVIIFTYSSFPGMLVKNTILFNTYPIYTRLIKHCRTSWYLYQ